MYVCICNAVTESDIQRCVAQGACSMSDLERELGVAAGCGCCREAASRALAERCASGVKQRVARQAVAPAAA